MRTTKNPKRKRPERPPEAGEKNDYARALDALTRYLALRDHSLQELRTKLGRNFEPELVEKLLSEADRNGWLTPEEQIAERLALSLARRHKSQMYINGQLIKRGLPPVKTDDESETEGVRHLLERKFGKGPLSLEEKNKAYRFLKYRGFQDNAIRKALNDYRQPEE